MGRGKPYTDDELLSAMAARDRGVSWRQIALDLGRDPKGLKQAVLAVYTEMEAEDA